MPKTENWFNQDLKKPIKVRALTSDVFTLDNVGSLIGVSVFDNGEPVTLTGTVNGYCIIPDGTTVSVAGTRSENTAYIELPQSALAYPGLIRIAIKLTNSSEITTLLAVAATVCESRTGTVITPSQQIITDWSQQIAAEMQAVEDASAAQDAKITDLKSALEITAPYFEQGGLDNNGVRVDSLNIILSGFFKISSSVTVAAKTGYQIRIATYYSNGSFKSWGTNYVTSKQLSNTTYLFRVQIIKTNTHDSIAPEEASSALESTSFTGCTFYMFSEDFYTDVERKNAALKNITDRTNKIEDRPYLKRKSVISFIFDGENTNDASIKAVFDNHNMKCGFAIYEHKQRYCNYFLEGFEVLANAAGSVPSSTADQEQMLKSAYDMVVSSVGVCNGWVTPQGSMSDYQLVNKYYAYGYTIYKGAVTTPSDACITSDQHTCALWRSNMDVLTVAQVKAIIDYAVANNTMVCAYGRGSHLGVEGYNLTLENIDEILTYCETVGIDVLTPNEANTRFFEYRHNEEHLSEVQRIEDLEWKSNSIFQKKTLVSTDGFISGKAWNIYSNAWYTGTNCAYKILKVEDVNNYIKIVSCYLNGTLPGVVFFSGEPSAQNYLGYDNVASRGSTTVVQATNVICNIPSGTTHIILQTGYKNSGTASFEIRETSFQYIDNKGIVGYSIDNNVIKFSSVYGDTGISFTFGKTGPNQLPDFISIKKGGTALYSHITDFFAPFMIKATENGDGGHPTLKYFTGGNHNYSNTGTSEASATARCLSLDFFADGESITNGDSGGCGLLRIEWVNRVQGYNTTKEDGTGREILEERHSLEFDGYRMRCDTELVVLEALTFEKWYGYQAYVSSSWPNITFVGATNRIPFTYSAGENSGNKTPNAMVCKSSTDVLEIEIDRTYDTGKAEFLDNSYGMFTNGSKAYCFIIKDHDALANEHYFLRGWYKFSPVT